MSPYDPWGVRRNDFVNVKVELVGVAALKGFQVRYVRV